MASMLAALGGAAKAEVAARVREIRRGRMAGVFILTFYD
jgi:hypothetical protein